jgi:tetratricopeptide (TPR) repeat protein
MTFFKYILLLIITFSSAVFSFGQKERRYIRQGNDEYDNQKYGNAEVTYQKASGIKPESFEAKFNLGDALYKQEKFDEAIEKFSQLANLTKDKNKLANIYHNIGNSQLNKSSKLLKENKLDEAIKQIDKSIDAYKSALKNNPSDRETKYNIGYANALKKLLEKEKEKQQQNQDQNKQDKNDKGDQQGDKDKQNQNNQNKPNENDSDGDGIPDKTEKGNNQEKPRDTDKDGTPDHKDQDSDNDSKPDSDEAGQQPENPQDTDKDGLPDYRDTDSDNDGKPDSQEVSENEQNQNQQKDQLTKEDAIRLLNAVENDEKNVQDKVKKVKGRKVRKSDKDW